jgi:hypothetical protein
VPEQSPLILGQGGYQVLAANDLGMHCGDLDTRIASILPPLQVLKSQVILRGQQPELQDGNQVEVFYSAASSVLDPAVLDPARQPNPPPGFELANGVYKTNFWDALNQGAYNPFYPFDITPPVIPHDLGLPIPDAATLPSVDAAQQAMPGTAAPYLANTPRKFMRFDENLQFFVNFPFGYWVNDLSLFSADGIPYATFDDAGRLNSYPLVRVEAKSTGGTSLATVDAVLPVSGEADCRTCHTDNDPANGILGGDGSATAGITVVNAFVDPQYGDVPLAVSVEYASDINMLMLHDLNEGSKYVASDGTAAACVDPSDPADPNCLVNQFPVVCQTCHYTPALDLAQVGPLGGVNGIDNDPSTTENANGRVQRVVKTMSRVMHEFHGHVAPLNTPMPGPLDPSRTVNGQPVINETVLSILDQTCYQCHPGKGTQCLRGAMFNGGMVCQDCHGDMAQVGNDFSENLSLATPFPAGADLGKRVPWASEPGCQSCHVGDAVDQPSDTSGFVYAPDGIRLLVAWKQQDFADGSSLAQPIESPDSRFAEDLSGDGKRILYRLSTGHEGVFCEGCHGSTHAIWPVTPDSGPFVANDNRAADQIQGHTGKIIECAACHGENAFALGDFQRNFDGNGRMKGPHGMHPVNDEMWTKLHKEVFNDDPTPAGTCESCHGQALQGTVLSTTAVERTLQCKDSNLPDCNEVNGRKLITIAKGTPVSCALCHKTPGAD